MDEDGTIEMLRNHLLRKGLKPLQCVHKVIVGTGDDRSLVVHFYERPPTLPGEEHLEYFDSHSTICVCYNLQSGKISVLDGR